MSLERPMHHTSWVVYLKASRWKSAKGAPKDIKKHGALTEERMERRAKVDGVPALFSTTNDGKKRREFVNRDFSAALYMSRCAMMEKRPQEWTKVIVGVE